MIPAIFHDPFHVATRGRFDGQYGIATRGLIVCPDIVPRYPQDAIVEEVDETPIAVVEAILFDGFVSDDGMLAKITEDPRAHDAEVVELVSDLVALMTDDDQFSAEVTEETNLGVVEDEERSAELEESGTIAQVVDEDAEAELSDDGMVSSVEDEPPHC